MAVVHVGYMFARFMGFTQEVIHETTKYGNKPRIHMIKGLLLQMPFYIIL
jgi:hypothetical protein